jgi:hypothetical protein
LFCYDGPLSVIDEPFLKRTEQSLMDILVADVGVEKAAEGACEIGTAFLPKATTTAGDSARATQDDSPGTLPGGPGSAVVDFDLTPDTPGHEAEGVTAQNNETRQATDEDDGLGDKDGVAPKSTTLDDAGEPAATADETVDMASPADAADQAEQRTASSETIEADGQPASDTSPGDDTPEQPQPAADEDLPKSTSVVDGSSEIFGPTRTKVMDLEAFGVPLDLDAYKDMFPEASEKEKSALLAHVGAVDEVIVDVAESGRVLDKRRTYQAAGASSRKIKIKVRVHYGLNEKQEIEKRYQLNEGGRQPIPKEKRRIKRERVWNLFRMRNILGLTITLEFISRHTGYSLAWISKLDKEFLASNFSSSEKAVKRNLNRKMTPELVAKANALIAQKTPIANIAKELGVHANTIRNSLKDTVPKATAPMAATAEPPARESAAIRTSRVTSRNTKSAQGPAALLDVGFDEDELVDTALDRCGIKQDEKSGWQSAGRQLLAEQRKNASGGHQDILKTAAQASVKFKAAAAEAEAWLKELLRTNAGEVA